MALLFQRDHCSIPSALESTPHPQYTTNASLVLLPINVICQNAVLHFS